MQKLRRKQKLLTLMKTRLRFASVRFFTKRTFH